MPSDPAKPAAIEQDIPWAELEEIVHRDPAGRGLASFRRQGAALDAGQLRAAAVHLAQHATAVGIVTGFCIVEDNRVTAETDGPPGALYLARALAALGIDVVLISDRYALPLLTVGREMLNLTGVRLVEFPLDTDRPDATPRAAHNAEAITERWLDTFLAAAPGCSLSHLIAIERPSPSHTLDSLAAQTRPGAAPLERFKSLVPAADRDVCHNMRGQSIDAYTGRTHRLFERIAAERMSIATIGIGDGGNEIGMGSFAWETIVEAVGGDIADKIAARIAARIPTDFAVIGGTSNWAAYALALALVRLKGAEHLALDWDGPHERGLLDALVSAGAVDGVTRNPAPTVDGLGLDGFFGPLAEMRSLLGIGNGARR